METTLQEILDARERRAQRQQELLRRFQKPLVSFTMNIAGPEKNSSLIESAFRLGEELLRSQLSAAGICLLFRESQSEPTGCEGFYVLDADPLQIKRLTVEVEESSPVARLFDMDVLTADGEKISRERLELPGRRCLLCDKPAYACSRSRAHSLAQLQGETRKLLREAAVCRTSRRIGAVAAKSLLYEVCTTPKPGLVDCHNSGSHRDMDIFTFMSSTAALQPYFTDCAKIGMETADLSPRETFLQLRFRGKVAEQEMYRATGGVNTHKGAIFSLGILCGAAGRLQKEKCFAQEILCMVREMTREITREDFAGITEDNAMTKGQRLYARHGITGIRGQAELGFPAVAEYGLPVLRQGIARGLSVNDAGCAALLSFMAHTPDTNLMARGDLMTQQRIAAGVAQLLEEEPYPTREVLEKLDRAFIQRNLSPGGCADLLAVTYFLWFLEQE